MIREALIKYYGTADEASDILQERTRQRHDLGLELADGGEITVDETDAPIIRMVSMLLIEAHRLGASDIHLEPLEKKFRVRFRIDGVLQEMQAPPKRLQAAIVSRLKIMSGTMSIAEKRLPQDGRIQVKIERKRSISAFPPSRRIMAKAWSCVSRQVQPDARSARTWIFLDDQATFERMLVCRMGFCSSPAHWFRQNNDALRLSQLHQQTRPEIITVEEPVEYQMTGINQVR